MCDDAESLRGPRGGHAARARADHGDAAAREPLPPACPAAYARDGGAVLQQRRARAFPPRGFRLRGTRPLPPVSRKLFQPPLAAAHGQGGSRVWISHGRGGQLPGRLHPVVHLPASSGHACPRPGAVHARGLRGRALLRRARGRLPPRCICVDMRPRGCAPGARLRHGHALPQHHGRALECRWPGGDRLGYHPRHYHRPRLRPRRLRGVGRVALPCRPRRRDACPRGCGAGAHLPHARAGVARLPRRHCRRCRGHRLPPGQHGL
mmetsp:Transcript_17727/g.51559  ORF Transcript_17727/g.51559 Transcript_17727/m.51559 type:complete len:264 (+) Transcript_17727:333-1124(+)